jgi:hypothetical protein
MIQTVMERHGRSRIPWSPFGDTSRLAVFGRPWLYQPPEQQCCNQGATRCRQNVNPASPIRVHGQPPPHGVWLCWHGGCCRFSVRAVTLKAFACSRALVFSRRLLRMSEALWALPSFHLHYHAPQSRPSTASIEAPLRSASPTQIGPLQTIVQTKGLAFSSPMTRRKRISPTTPEDKRFQILYACGERLCFSSVGHLPHRPNRLSILDIRGLEPCPQFIQQSGTGLAPARLASAG